MNPELFGFIIDAIGKVLVAWTAIGVHVRVRKEHKIDKRVFKAMRREHVIGIIGVALIIVGTILQVPRFM